MKLFALIIASIFIQNMAIAQMACEKEKDEVDRWNRILKNNVTETARDKHRDAKERFLKCLHDQRIQPEITKPKDAKPEQKKYSSIKKNSPTTRKTVQSKKPIQYGTNTVTTAYTHYRGEKLKAWHGFFQESPECKNNSGDMGVFVKCSAMRKEQLAIFERRWDDSQQRLRPLLD